MAAQGPTVPHTVPPAVHDPLLPGIEDGSSIRVD
jgi:hypothetical protein